MTIAIFGEALFDVFPGGKKVAGGAPFNVAWHIHGFGAPVRFISRLGNDELGKAFFKLLKNADFPTQAIQQSKTKPTGQVEVTLDNGEPSYEIKQDVAYDEIAPDTFDEPYDLLYHGTLALRTETSLKALEAARTKAARVFMDVNLRDPFWEKSTVLSLAKNADWVKVNQDEFQILAGEPYNEESARALLSSLELEGLLITLGEKGACVYTAADQQCATVLPKPQQGMVDAVGAGDAFSAVFIFGLLHNWPMQAIMSRAQSFASHILPIEGATSADAEFYTPFRQAWHTDETAAEL